MKGQPGVLMIDQHEPPAIVTGLSQVNTVSVLPLNLTWDKADYYMVDVPQENERMVERKQLSEALSDLNAVEEQLGRQLHHCDELTLLVEGVGMPTATGVQIYTYKSGQWEKGYEHKNQPALWKRWTSFKHALRHNAGVEVEETAHWYGTVQFLGTWFDRANDPTSTTLKRYIIPHMPPFHRDPHVDNLCRLKGYGIGEATAIKLVEEFGSFYGVVTAEFADLVGVMGGAWTRKFFEASGRE